MWALSEYTAQPALALKMNCSIWIALNQDVGGFKTHSFLKKIKSAPFLIYLKSVRTKCNKSLIKICAIFIIEE